jgi:hypothetical protein
VIDPAALQMVLPMLTGRKWTYAGQPSITAGAYITAEAVAFHNRSAEALGQNAVSPITSNCRTERLITSRSLSHAAQLENGENTRLLTRGQHLWEESMAQRVVDYLKSARGQG